MTKYKYLNERNERAALFNLHLLLKLELAYQLKRIADTLETKKRKR